MNIYDTKIWKKFTQKTPNQEQLQHIQQIIKQFKVKPHQIRIIADFCEVNLKGDWLDAYSKVVHYFLKICYFHTSIILLLYRIVIEIVQVYVFRRVFVYTARL